jgi:heterodisulfide reductase subunit B
VNLDLKQGQINSALDTDYKVPILYLTQVLGLAFGMSDEDVMLQKNIVDPRPLVKKAKADAAAIKAEEDRKAAEKAAKEAAKAAKAAESADAAPAKAAAPAGATPGADEEVAP